ncbi:type II toxin-antitoxin system HicB family antitoxin [Faecalitalea cylindroides]|uniref:type II toxin-antitoxin system HicB family antitoxin n=1 Tax=Faecalitalea cylindroides TaxID=39483 RepID=UPI0023309681|nr:type II toxin-antitoxin system HicB family antitoxin [Faecalitalea cylindroides]MDB7951575.1 type II toxin-antitoxin system HicB family antitoxin [Faecalitalea cylindroides]MDB7958420.1 type II toxin-antitoxin system HicB family antitoxin [Faecalitalea cylindroides]MDB7960400.1 type II toxin-antitoxin system HicB family antitoxin [Faecalitalea cylindroides]MDB7962270.1 type II toxin-antitoxin system HicB family antitoxin [Faecalitalea cylindroides]MDB7964141.1 type II toxin-antitoxin system
MLSIYPAIFYKEKNGYSVIFPDLNYLSTCGENLNDAMEMAIDCLAGYLYIAKLDDDKLPEPSKIDDIHPIDIANTIGFDGKDSFINLISVDLEDYAKTHFNKSVKKTLTIPEWLNREATKKNINFSKVLQEALIAKLRSL